MKSRGKDQLIAGALVVECVRLTDAERVVKTLQSPPPTLGMSGPTVLGIYSLLCIYTK
jgi:hypothetical protein